MFQAVTGFKIPRRRFLGLAGLAGMGLAATAIAPAQTQTRQDTIKIGLLHSLTGTMAISETTLLDAEYLAIAQINRAGGVLGRQIEAVIEDGASDWPTFAEKAQKLIRGDRVAAVFGCWTSASRKSVLPVFETFNSMLWYPVAYEGQECSKNIFYTGAVPNQNIEPAIDWLLENKSRQVFLVGSDYIFPRTANEIVKQQVVAKGGEVVGEDYLPLGDTRLTRTIENIQQRLPKGGAIFNTLNGDSNISLFRLFQAAGLQPKHYPIMSVHLYEDVIPFIGSQLLQGHYVVANYFQAIDTPMNQMWVADFQAVYGSNRPVTDPMAAAYTAIYLWKQAVDVVGDPYDIDAVRQAAYGQQFEGPEGLVTMNVNHHLSRPVYIGRFNDRGGFDLVYQSNSAIDPDPWNQRIAASRGFGCDWSDASRGGRYSTTDTD